ncbi:glycine zipper 2TM domain-containing protein [Shimia ponticola]|uniref:glycine zipper 2TM domain-containing protein n=1 Tax=Shimia ponticola TaxID=2582893 RepID=UPI0011BDF412|nr:glycine zipper 2TM domain-containing protein [Shimia ponticola]
MTKLTAAFALIAMTTLGACSTLTAEERSVATGATIGAVAGAALAGDNTQGRGAVVGATIGALAGSAAANR